MNDIADTFNVVLIVLSDFPPHDLYFTEACRVRLKRTLQPSPQGCAKPNPSQIFLYPISVPLSFHLFLSFPPPAIRRSQTLPPYVQQ